MHVPPFSSRLLSFFLSPSIGGAARAALLCAVPLLAACPGSDDEGDGNVHPAASAGAGAGAGTGTGGTGAGGGGGASSGGAGDGGAAALPTHSGIVSIQDASIVGAPEGVPGLTVQVLFTAARAPVFDDNPGQPVGCKVWVHDVATAPPPPVEDHGALHIDGVAGAARGGIDCAFDAGAYACSGLPAPGADPIPDGAQLSVSLAAGGGHAFDDFAVGPIAAGSAFALDPASLATLADIPLDGAAMTLGCAQPGASCGAAAGTLLRLSTTDAPTEGLGPFEMPPAIGKQVEMQCVLLGGEGNLTVPAAAMAVLAAAHRASPFTRIRTAFMREGLALAPNAPPSPPNTAYVLVGHGLLGFSNP